MKAKFDVDSKVYRLQTDYNDADGGFRVCVAKVIDSQLDEDGHLFLYTLQTLKKVEEYEFYTVARVPESELFTESEAVYRLRKLSIKSLRAPRSSKRLDKAKRK